MKNHVAADFEKKVAIGKPCNEVTYYKVKKVNKKNWRYLAKKGEKIQ